MTVAAILKSKGSLEVTTVGAQASIGDCARLLSEKKIGALVVSEDGRHVDGVLSERDLVRMLAQDGAGCLAKPASVAMTRKVETCELDERGEELLRRMTEGRFRHMPVMKDGALHAVLSIGDVVKYRISEIEMEKHALEDMIKGN